jgi:hypothetical protein
MTVAANPLCQLAPCTRSKSCVYAIRLPFNATMNSLPLRQNQTSPAQCSAVFSTSPTDHRSQEHPRDKEMAFNRHNPSLDHRGR